MNIRPIILPLILLLATACSNNNGGPVFTDEDRDAKEEILGNIHSIDSLNEMLLNYEEQTDELGQIMTYRYMGVYYREQNQNFSALNHFQHGLAHANEMNDTIEIMKIHNQIAFNYLQMGQLENATQHLLNSLALSTRYKDRYNRRAQQNLADTYNGMGHVFRLISNKDQADGAFRAALNIEHQLNGNKDKELDDEQLPHKEYMGNDSLITSRHL